MTQKDEITQLQLKCCLTDAQTLPGRGAFSGSELVYHRFQSRGYCSNEAISPWKLASLSSSVMLSQLESASQLEHGLSI